MEVGKSDAAAHVLLKTVGFITVVWLILLSLLRNYLVEMLLDNFGSEMACCLNTRIIDWKQVT